MALDNLYLAIKEGSKEDIRREIIFYRNVNPDKHARNGWKDRDIIREVLNLKES